jgi:hypothetical protein
MLIMVTSNKKLPLNGSFDLDTLKADARLSHPSDGGSCTEMVVVHLAVHVGRYSMREDGMCQGITANP